MMPQPRAAETCGWPPAGSYGSARSRDGAAAVGRVNTIIGADNMSMDQLPQWCRSLGLRRRSNRSPQPRQVTLPQWGRSRGLRRHSSIQITTLRSRGPQWCRSTGLRRDNGGHYGHNQVPGPQWCRSHGLRRGWHDYRTAARLLGAAMVPQPGGCGGAIFCRSPSISFSSRDDAAAVAAETLEADLPVPYSDHTAMQPQP